MLPPRSPAPSQEQEISSSNSSIQFEPASLPLDYSGMFAALTQLQADLADEREKREQLEIKQRQLTFHMYNIVAEHMRGMRALQKLILGLEQKNEEITQVFNELDEMKFGWSDERFKSFSRARRRIKRRLKSVE